MALPVRVIAQLVHPIFEDAGKGGELSLSLGAVVAEVNGLFYGGDGCAAAPWPITEHGANLVGVLRQVHRVDLSSDSFFGFSYQISNKGVAVSVPDAVRKNGVHGICPFGGIPVIIGFYWAFF